MKIIVCTGGTHVGKTSVLEYLEKQGYTRFESVGGKHIDTLIQLLGFEASKEWRKKYFLDFQKMNIFGDIDIYNEAKNLTGTKEDIVFLDRGVFDRIASLKRENILILESLEELIRSVGYDKKVFLFDPIPEHNTREQTGRMLDRETSILWAKYIEEEYIFRGYEIVKIPFFDFGNTQESIQARAKFLLENI